MFENYEIVEVDDSNKHTYCMCLEEWSDEIREAGDNKACWYEKMKDKGLGVKLVKDRDGTISGMIQYVPAGYAPLTGDGYYFIYCVWVHGHKQGIGDRRGSGMGTMLLEAAEQDMRSKGAKGAAAWGLSLPIWMKASWYKKHGYRTVQKDGIRHLLWKSFSEGSGPPQWLELKKRPEPLTESGKLRVTSVVNGICPVTNLAYERAKAVSAEFADSVEFNEIWTDDPSIMNEWGVSDLLIIGSRVIALGPPLPKEKIRKAVKKQLRKDL